MPEIDYQSLSEQVSGQLIKCGRIVIRLQCNCVQPLDILTLLSQTLVKENVVNFFGLKFCILRRFK